MLFQTHKDKDAFSSEHIRYDSLF